MSVPAISVVMPVYDGEKYLQQAIDSILHQTFDDFEFIIVDDASTDGTANILGNYDDKRIIKLRNSKNVGVASSLNYGIKLAKGEFVARMDADDISLPKRLETQYEYLRANKNVAVLGSACELIYANGKRTSSKWIPVVDIYLLKWKLLFKNNVIHPTVMFRRDLIESLGSYSSEFSHNEDYFLWVRVSSKFNIVNLKDILLYYRVHGNSVSNIEKVAQHAASISVSQYAMSQLLNDASIYNELVCFLLHPYSANNNLALQAITQLDRLYESFITRYPQMTKRQREKINVDFSLRKKQLLKLYHYHPKFFRHLISIVRLNPALIRVIAREFVNNLLNVFQIS